MTKTDLSPDDSWEPVDDTGFIDHVGPIYFQDAGDDPQNIGFRATEKHRNLNGVVQGGMLMTLADRGMGRIARRISNGPVATVHFSYDFLGAAHLGQFVELRPKITRETGSLVFMEAQVFSDGDLIGRGNGVWKKLKRLPKAKN